MTYDIFTPDVPTGKTPILHPRRPITEAAAVIEADPSSADAPLARAFAEDVEQGRIRDFEREGVDHMCHVSTFIETAGRIFVSYYANTSNSAEDPLYQSARLAYCFSDDMTALTVLDIQSAGDTLCGREIVGVYDTILMQREEEPDTIYILWTANVEGMYYRLYRTFHIPSNTLSIIGVNRFRVGSVTNDFSASGMQSALCAGGIGYKAFFSDIGIMQKLSWRLEHGDRWYYSGTYSGNFTCIIKSRDLITWEYVAQPDEGANGSGFHNESKWENAVYVWNDRVYYFVRQWDPQYKENGTIAEGSPYGFLTYYDLIQCEWAKPVLIGDCQSRGDFFYYKGELYLFHAPTDREHIGILHVDPQNLANSTIVLQAKMHSSCFYPFVRTMADGGAAISYTVARKHIRLARFTMDSYIGLP